MTTGSCTDGGGPPTARTSAVKGHPGLFKDQVTGQYGFVTGLPAGRGGKRRQVKRRGFRTIAKAKAARDKLRASVADDSFVEPTKISTGEWLSRWLDGRRASLRPGTHLRYASWCAPTSCP